MFGGGTHGLHGFAVRQQHVMRGSCELAEAQFVAGRVHALLMAEPDENRGLVEGHPMLHAIGQALDDHARIVRKPRRRITIEPAAAMIQRERQIPMKQRDVGLDVGGQQCVDQAIVKGQTRVVDRAHAARQNTRPRDAQAIGVEANLLHQRDVLSVAVIVIARDVAGVTLADGARLFAEHVPHRGAFAVLGRSTFDLIGSGSGAPGEVFWEWHGSLEPSSRTWNQFQVQPSCGAGGQGRKF